MNYFFTSMFVLFIFLFHSGCISPNPAIAGENQSHFAEEIHASQSYYDQLVTEDPLNATAWCIRGNYYNNVFNQYEKALQCYDQGLDLDPTYGYCWYSKGITLQNMKRFNESEICFENAKKFDPTLPV